MTESRTTGRVPVCRVEDLPAGAPASDGATTRGVEVHEGAIHLLPRP